MDGFDRVTSHCFRKGHCPGPASIRAYGYVPQSEVKPYYKMAEQYTFADATFQTNEGPSLPAHQYLVSGTSTTYDGSPYRVSENTGKHLGGCDSPAKTRVPVINQRGQENKKVFPCFDRRSIFTLLDAAGISWKYYQDRPGPGLWHAVDALKPIWSNHQEYRSNVVTNPSQVLTDISNGNLASVVYVTPTAKASDHPVVTDGTGPSWVASVVNAVGKSPYWKSSAIIVTWDDWGGWYDHAKPMIRQPYELGFRVPMLVISPYARTGYVSHVRYEFGSILKFIEETFAMPSLGTTDTNANDLSDCFTFGAGPRVFTPIAAEYSARYFLAQPQDLTTPDD
jgi:phospholipase C